MKKETIAGAIFIFIFLMFTGLYFTSGSGYYETEERKKTTLTENQIKAFERDVNEGKQVDIQNYLKLNEKNYDNQISSTALLISNKIGKTFEKGLNTFFDSVAGAMGKN